jgi:tetratricopeptide (TPR) repeat protein
MVELNEGISELSDLGTFFASKGYQIEAIPVLMEVIHRDTLNSTKAYSNLGMCYYELGINDKAIKYLVKAIAINPDDNLAIEVLQRLYNKVGDDWNENK